MKKRVIPSIIATSQEELTQRILRMKQAKLLQLDIMDGKFVKNKSLWWNFTLPTTNCTYEAHLMVNNPLAWIKKHYHKADMIIFHLEAVKNPHFLIRFIKNKKKQVGIAINPSTPIKKLEPFLNDIDQVVIMTVKPGKYGSTFLPKTLEKVKKLRKHFPKLSIEVDGGINDQTATIAATSGANKFISGSYLVNSSNVSKSLRRLRELLQQG